MFTRILFAAVLLAAAVPAGADETYVATLRPQPGTGSTGSGSAVLLLNDAETELSYNISYSGLLGTEIAAHIHGPDGSIVHPLPNGTPKVGVWTNPGLINVLFLRSGQLFILLHTTSVPQGELRGNIVLAQTPVERTTWGRIKALLSEASQ